jgi:hypothetical protein
MFEPIIPWNTAFSGSLTYENETSVSLQEPGYTVYYGAITGATIRFGADGALGIFDFAAKPYGSYTTQSSLITFTNDLVFDGNPPYDQFNFTASLGSSPGDPANMFRFLSFSTSDYTGQQLPTGQTLLDPLPVAALTSGFHQLSFAHNFVNEAGEEESTFVGSQQISLTLAPTAVPEPGSLVLFGAGLIGVALARRRRLR